MYFSPRYFIGEKNRDLLAMTFLHFSSYICQHFVLAERKIKYAFKCQTLESKEKHSSIHSEKNPNHKQVLVYLKLHQVHIKPRKMKQMRESNLHKGHQFQGNNIVDSSQTPCSFTADSSHKIGPAFPFPAFLAYFLPPAPSY